MIVVAIIGVLAAVAIPAFSRYVRKSKTPEAMALLHRIHAGATTYYETDHADVNGTTLPKQFPGPAGVQPGPNCGCRPGGKCPPAPAGDPISQALKLAQPDPHNYRGEYYGSGIGTSSIFTSLAIGDLDCDGLQAVFARRGWISPQGDVTGNTMPIIVNETE